MVAPFKMKLPDSECECLALSSAPKWIRKQIVLVYNIQARQYKSLQKLTLYYKVADLRSSVIKGIHKTDAIVSFS